MSSILKWLGKRLRIVIVCFLVHLKHDADDFPLESGRRRLCPAQGDFSTPSTGVTYSCPR